MRERELGILQRTTDDEALERSYGEGYQRKPECPSVGKLGEKMAREVWPDEAWDDARDR
jgi:hypothetical protein